MNMDLLRKYAEHNQKNSIFLRQRKGDTAANTRIGGNPLLPADFQFPEYDGKPLSFLAQIDCAEIHALDQDNLLPDHGILSFFYELDSQKWGYDPNDAGCARVFWFEDCSALRETVLPDTLAADFRVPAVAVETGCFGDCPDDIDDAVFEELTAASVDEDEIYEAFDEMRREQFADDVRIKLLGYPDRIQGEMQTECELVSRGHYVGRGYPKLSDAEKAELHACAENWILLFQFDTVEADDYELMFGDCGRIYYYIRKDDLAARRFDRVWLILQCF